MADFVAGCFAGACGALVSHPIDSVKTVYQMDSGKYKSILHCAKELYKEGGVKRYYCGLKGPLFGIALEKCIVFGSYNTVHQYTQSIVASGFFAGVCASGIVVPVEKIKILQQQKLANSSFLEVLKTQGIRKLYSGTSACIAREGTGFAIYFSTYETLKNKQKNTALENKWCMPFLNGCLSGLSSWLVIYPTDPVKTLMQTKNAGLIDAVKTIYKNNGIGGFYKAMSLGLMRSVPLHGGVFAGYELFKSLTA
jgi:hypothetical protein